MLWEKFLNPSTVTFPFENRVDLEVVVYFKHRPYDSSNIPLKMIEDGLKPYLIKDDSIAYVRRVMAESRIDKERPRVEINLTEVLP